jgi:Spy/CpxP family protein refolding chaperone
MKSRLNVLAAILVAGGSLLTVATGFSIANAQDSTAAPAPPPGPHGHHAWGPWRIYSKLGLTAEQQSSIKAILTAAKPQMQSLHQQMHANHLKLRETTPDDPNYASVVTATSQADATLAAQATTQREAVRAQMYAVLTPAQKTQLAALEAQWAANPHQGRWGARGTGAPPAPTAD